jgi:hypothetical protein
MQSMKDAMHYAPNKALEHTCTRLHALTGGILVQVAQRYIRPNMK